MRYLPLNYNQINAYEGFVNPSQVKSINNRSFAFWERSLFQRACSTLILHVPDEWSGNVRDFLYYCLFKFGFVAVLDNPEHGRCFQPCQLSGYNFYYQPTDAIISNPQLQTRLKIGEECELLKLTPDYQGIWDIIIYYAEKLSMLDSAINMSLINSKFAYVLGAKNKAAAEALKKILDKINKGEPTVIADMRIADDPVSKDSPFQFFERRDLKQTYLTTDQLLDFQTMMNNFDTEIGIPTIPYQKKERMVTSEAESRIIDSTSRSNIWYDTLTDTIKKVNDMYPGINLSVELRYKEEGEQ